MLFFQNKVNPTVIHVVLCHSTSVVVVCIKKCLLKMTGDTALTMLNISTITIIIITLFCLLRSLTRHLYSVRLRSWHNIVHLFLLIMFLSWYHALLKYLAISYSTILHSWILARFGNKATPVAPSPSAGMLMP